MGSAVQIADLKTPTGARRRRLGLDSRVFAAALDAAAREPLVIARTSGRRHT